MVLKDKYRITKLDNLNIMLEVYKEVINPKTKESSYKWVTVGYFKNLELIYKRIIDNEVIETGLEEFKIVIDKIEKLKLYIEEQLG